MSNQYAEAAVPAAQVNVAELPLSVVPGTGVCITANPLVAFNDV